MKTIEINGTLTLLSEIACVTHTIKGESVLFGDSRHQFKVILKCGHEIHVSESFKDTYAESLLIIERKRMEITTKWQNELLKPSN